MSKYTGQISKLISNLDSPISYTLPIGENKVPLNNLIVHSISSNLNLLDSYVSGVNDYINSLNYKDLPVEYKILDYKPEKWTLLKTFISHVMNSKFPDGAIKKINGKCIILRGNVIDTDRMSMNAIGNVINNVDSSSDVNETFFASTGVREDGVDI